MIKRIRTQRVPGSEQLPMRHMDWMAFDTDWDGTAATIHQFAVGYGPTELAAAADCRDKINLRTLGKMVQVLLVP